MKSIHLLTRLLPAVALAVASLTLLPAQGQNYVTGDKYQVSAQNIDIVNYAIEESENLGGRYNQNGNVRYLNDGNLSQTVSAPRQGETVIVMDLGSSHDPVNRIYIYTSTNNTQLRPASLTVETSSNQNGWSSAGSFTFTRFNAEEQVDLSSPITVRYVRLTFQSNNHDDARNTFREIYLQNVSDLSSQTMIKHKPAKWHHQREGLSQAALNSDNFSDDVLWETLENGTKVQATHIYSDTLYVHKGTRIQLDLPDRQGTSPSSHSYQRWYSYRTDGTFQVTNANNDENVVDLLTPVSGTMYRFANGYVCNPLPNSSGGNLYMNFYFPTDKEFRSWFPNSDSRNMYYVVACDISNYKDFTKTFNSTTSSRSTFFPSNQSDGQTYEPTLMHRVLFYIVAVDDRDGETDSRWTQGYGRLSESDYQNNGDAYLETYNITYPARTMGSRIVGNRQDYSRELVTLSKDAQGYAIPGVSRNSDSGSLIVTIENGQGDMDPGVFLTDADGQRVEALSLSGTDRIIRFNYPNNDNTTGIRSVNNINRNPTARILVKKQVDSTTYNVACYNLTFVDGTRLLTQTQVDNIDNNLNYSLNDLYYRTPQYLDNNYELLTSLDFDFSTTVSGNADYYPYPLAWTSNSYGFYDGTAGNDYAADNKFPEWGFYGITKLYIENANWNANKPVRPTSDHSTYHLYVDASDRPGVIARLPFDQTLCQGSELFVSAWVKSAGYSSGSDDAGMLFTVMGVTEDAAGNKSYTPIYRHATGQIRRTDYLSTSIDGCGNRNNEWLQVFFSFINSSDQVFDSYELQVDNLCESTNGGDMYLDDVRVYFMQPTAEVTQLEANCTNERTLMKLTMDWGRLMSRTGHDENVDAGAVDAMDFCFIDRTRLENYLAERGKTIETATDEERLAALEQAEVMIGDAESYDSPFATLYFHVTYADNVLYRERTETGPGGLPQRVPNLAVDNTDDQGRYYFYRADAANENQRALVVDFYSALTPNRPYWLLMRVHQDGVAPSAASFAADLIDPCGMRTEFWVDSQTLLKMNGQVVDPQTSFCAGQVYQFGAQLRVPQVDHETGEESYILVDEGVNFDWFFGSEPEFLKNQRVENGVLVDGDENDESLESALTSLRACFPVASEISEQTTPVGVSTTVDGQPYEFTQAMYDLLYYYSHTPGIAGGLNNRLVLNRETLDITLLQSGLELVVQPIPTITPPGGISAEAWSLVCWEHIPLVLLVNDEGPTVHTGFEEVQYPADDFNPSLRIGLKQYEDAVADRATLRVNLRGVDIPTEGATHLGIVTSAEGMDEVYLISTDDPAYAGFLNREDFTEYDLPIGKLTSLDAREYPYQDSPEAPDFENSYMEVQFYGADHRIDVDGMNQQFSFQPREGYTYTFAVHCEEKLNSPTTGNACFAVFNVPMKIVPEYLEWQGGKDGNWNNDANWKRINRPARLNMTGSDYFDGNDTENGFVPMLFSKVVMPQDSQVELYLAGYNSANVWQASANRPDHVGSPTENIQYDLMAYNGNPQSAAMTTERYRVNLCDQIHIEPRAEVLHAEQLIYNKAWTDVEIPTGQWGLYSTPLRNVYAGDWYTQSSGKQETPYFTDITFGTGYDRLTPAVFQRTMADGAQIVENNGGNTTPVFFTAAWSAAYNDTDVPYTAASGFSLAAKHSAQTVQVRLPKADTQYEVGTGDGPLDRTNAGKLVSSQLMDRSNPNAPQIFDDFKVTLTPSADGRYFLVGNPFPAHLDVNDFLEANGGVLAQKYWMVNDNGPIAGSADAEGKWTETGQEKTLLPPYGAFYAERAGNDGTGNVTVRFTADMQTFAPTAGDDSGQSGATTTGVRVTAQSEGGRSTAVVTFSESADNDFAAEDAQLLRDESLTGADQPYVYTVAGTMAAAVNRVRDLAQIPLGVFAAEGKPVMLTFTGLDATERAALYDAELQSERPLHEGDQLSLTGSSHGRYFLRLVPAEPTGIAGVTDGEESITVYSVTAGEVIASAPEALTRVEVYDTAGRRVRALNGTGDTVLRADGLTAGTYVVRAATASAQRTVKLVVE